MNVTVSKQLLVQRWRLKGEGVVRLEIFRLYHSFLHGATGVPRPSRMANLTRLQSPLNVKCLGESVGSDGVESNGEDD